MNDEEDNRYRLRLPDMCASLYALKILEWLYSSQLLTNLLAGLDVYQVARARDLSRDGLDRCLRFLTHVSDLVQERSVGVYCLKDGVTLDQLSHCLDLNLGAFGPCFDNLNAIFSGGDGSEFVDWGRHAKAFSVDTLDPITPRVLAELNVKCVVDLGCGDAQLLERMAGNDPEFYGIGVDANAAIVDSARNRLAGAASNNRVELRDGDIMDLRRVLTDEVIDRVQVVCVRSVANGFFGNKEGRRINDLLSMLASIFAGRILLLADYYSKLDNRDSQRRYWRTLVHDIAQIASGQGVPPTSLEEWRDIYQKSSVNLFKELHYTDGSIDHFIHLAQL